MTPDGESPVSRSGRWRVLAQVLLAVAPLILLAYLYFGRESGIPDHVFRDYRAFQRGTLDLQMLTTRHETLETFFEHRGVPFPVHVADLSSMGFALVGGRVHELDGRPSALFVYRDPQGTLVVRQVFEGREADLPSGLSVREGAGTPFRIRRRGKVTLVFWQEGSLLCALTSEADAERLLELANGDRSIFRK